MAQADARCVVSVDVRRVKHSLDVELSVAIPAGEFAVFVARRRDSPVMAWLVSEDPSPLVPPAVVRMSDSFKTKPLGEWIMRPCQ